MKVFYAFFLLLLAGCSSETPAVSGPASQKQTPETIQKIEVMRAGGDMGYSAILVLTKDSVLFRSDVVVDSTLQQSFGRQMVPAQWQQLTANVDLADFESAQDGHSEQPADGVDTEIIVTTNKRALSKRNAYENKTWDALAMSAELFQK